MADKIGEVQSYVASWAQKTDEILLMTLKRLNVGHNEDLFRSLRSKVYRLAGDTVGYDLTFLLHGRFRDMNVGRGRGKSSSLKIENTASNRQIVRKRGVKPAKWFSKPFYGRLNALQGAIGYSLMEQSIQSITKTLEGND